MPIYTYQILKQDGSPGESFEVLLKLSDPPLERHPETGEKVTRVYKPVHIAGMTSALHSKTLLSDKNLEKNGFTAYRRNGKGHYERTAGSGGPESLSPND